MVITLVANSEAQLRQLATINDCIVQHSLKIGDLEVGHAELKTQVKDIRDDIVDIVVEQKSTRGDIKALSIVHGILVTIAGAIGFKGWTQ